MNYKILVIKIMHIAKISLRNFRNFLTRNLDFESGFFQSF